MESAEQRRIRLAQALRNNLRRRKAQARGEGAAPDGGAPDRPAKPAPPR